MNDSFAAEEQPFGESIVGFYLVGHLGNLRSHSRL